MSFLLWQQELLSLIFATLQFQSVGVFLFLSPQWKIKRNIIHNEKFKKVLHISVLVSDKMRCRRNEVRFIATFKESISQLLFPALYLWYPHIRMFACFFLLLAWRGVYNLLYFEKGIFGMCALIEWKWFSFSTACVLHFHLERINKTSCEYDFDDVHIIAWLSRRLLVFLIYKGYLIIIA